MLSSLMQGLSKTPRQLALLSKRTENEISKSKLLRFVKSRQNFTNISNDEIKDQNVFKEVYMKKKHKDSYFKLLKLRRVEVYYKNVTKANRPFADNFIDELKTTVK